MAGIEVWEIRKAQAEKFLDWSAELKKVNRVEGAFYLAHMSVELVMKAAIARKRAGWHPTTGNSHILMKLVSDSQTQFLIADMANDVNTNIHKNFTMVHNQKQAWDMHYRYEGTKLTDSEMAQTLEIYSEVFEWTKNTYLK
jgi:HEPN domain-containing protein